MKRIHLLLFTFLSIPSLFAMQEDSLFLEKIKKPHFCCYLQILPQDLLYELTFYMSSQNPNHAIHLFQHLNPTDKQMDAIIARYINVSTSSIPDLQKDLTLLSSSKGKERLYSLCALYDIAYKKIKEGIKKSDQKLLQPYLSESTPLLAPINVREIKEKVQRNNQKRNYYISFLPFVCEQETAKNSICGCLALLAIIGSGFSALFIPIPGFNFYQCNQSIENSCETKSSPFGCLFNETWRLVLCCQQYAYKNCTLEQQIFENHQTILMPFMPLIVTCSVLTCIATIACVIKKCSSPKPISRETESLLRSYQQKMQQRDPDIAEMV